MSVLGFYDGPCVTLTLPYTAGITATGDQMLAAWALAAVSFQRRGAISYQTKGTIRFRPAA